MNMENFPCQNEHKWKRLNEFGGEYMVMNRGCLPKTLIWKVVLYIHISTFNYNVLLLNFDIGFKRALQ